MKLKWLVEKTLKVKECSTWLISLSHSKYNAVNRSEKLKACFTWEDTNDQPSAWLTMIKADSIGAPLVQISVLETGP